MKTRRNTCLPQRGRIYQTQRHGICRKLKRAPDGMTLHEPAPERRAPKEPPVPVEKKKAKRKAA